MISDRMPSGTEPNKGAFSPKQRAAKHSRDKAVEAQRKNKLEATQLQLFQSLVDRSKVRASVMYNREKDDVRSKMKQMRKTTGRYKRALPPDGPSDKDHEKSPYFQTLGHVSEKRLQKWKNEERALQRIKLSEEELRPPWEKDSKELAEKTLGHLLNMLGYDEHETKDVLRGLRQDKVWEINGEDAPEKDEPQSETRRRKNDIHSAELVSGSKASSGGVSGLPERVDVFECLKGDQRIRTTFINSNTRERQNERTFDLVSVEDISSMIQGGKHDREFSVSTWEKSIIEQYKNKLINPTVQANKKPRQKVRALKDRPKSAPAQTGNALNRRGQLSSGKRKSHLLRYHEAGPQKMESVNDLENVERETHKSKSGSKNENLNACGSIRPAPIHRQISALPPRAVEATRSMVASRKPTPKTTYRKMPACDYNIHHEKLASRHKATPAVLEQNSKAVSSLRLDCEGKDHYNLHSYFPELSQQKATDTGHEKKVIWSVKEDTVCSPSRGDGQRHTLNDVFNNNEAPTKSNSQHSIADPQMSYAQTQNKFQRRQRSLSVPAAVTHAGIDEVTKRTVRRCESAFVNNTADSHVFIGGKRGGGRGRGHHDSADLSDQYEEADGDISGVPSDVRTQWRRRVLAEAPRGLAGGTGQKVRLAVSKYQLRRDMEKMIVDQDSDLQEQIRKERIRRMRRRMDILLTLQKLCKRPPKEADESLRDETKEKETSPEMCRLRSTTKAIMHILRMSKNVRSPQEKC